MAPATPTGLMVSEITETSITWTWDASEGALGYAVQVSLDEMFDDMDQIGLTQETSFTATPIPPRTSVFLRVRAGTGTPEALAAALATGSLEGLVLSAWTTHVTGMSDMPVPEPVPEPEPLDPVMVMFSLSDDADSQHFMMADKDDDEATAMATVNTEIMVESNTTAVITPMFVDGASGVSVDAGADNVPFSYVDWGLLQSAVLDGGATFMVQRTTVGANQEMEPSGDVAYVTCGPFACADGSDAPMLSIENSGVCSAWDPMVEIQVGKIDNDVLDADDNVGEGEDDRTNDGVDLGIVTSSNGIAMTLKHVFSGVTGGTNTSVKTGAEEGSNKALTMKVVPDSDAVTVDTLGEDGAVTAMACDNPYDMGTITDRPDGCFRFVGPGAKGRHDSKGKITGPDYLAGYSIELSPVGANVGWGRVDWKDDPFEDLTCGDADPITVSDDVNICDMFEDEVDWAIGEGWSPTVVFTDDRVFMWMATAEKSGNGVDADGDAKPFGGKNFKTLWFDDNLNGKIGGDGDANREGTLGTTTANPMHDLYDQNDSEGNIEAIWEFLTDADGDLTAGDLGKADLRHFADDDDTDVDETQPGNPDGIADNYLDTDGDPILGADDYYKCSEADGGDDDDGTICDATWSTTEDVVFADGTFGCTATRPVTVTCTWDADGGMAQGRNALPTAFDGDDPANLKFFLKCEAE